MIKFGYIVLLFAFTFCRAQVMWQFDKDSLITWYYQDGDEFNGTKVNTNVWGDWYGWARSISSNKEQQYYTQFKNHFLKDGKLILTAKRQDINARYVDWMADNDTIKNNGKFDGLNKRDFTYSAGMIQSLKDYQYGFFEIKFKIPKEKGFWPAFWLYGATPNEEIDWMELKTEKPNQIHVGRHCQKKEDNYTKTLFGKKVWGDWVKFEGSLNEGYNVLSGVWTANYLKYYLNGECIAIAYTKMPHPKKLVANIAVSSDKGSFPPAPPKDFKDSVNFEIDYIRVWDRSNYAMKNLRVSSYTAKEPVTGSVEIENSALISKSKMHYGKKSLHANEGFFVSLMPQEGSKYQLSVLGKEIPTDGVVTLQDETGKIISQTNLKYGVSTYDLLQYQGMILKLHIKALGKEANFDLTVN
jgi:beta-glucanase (GH16 family)